MRWLVLAAALVVLLAGGIAYATGLVGWDRLTGYYAPVFSPEGDAVYYLQRDTSGVSWGLGWEFFSPPASARAASDTLSLRRLDLAARRVEVLEEWRDSPILGRTVHTYRPALYLYLSARLRAEEPGVVDYAAGLAIPIQPRSTPFRLEGTWSADPAKRKRGEWRDGDASVGGYSRWPLAGDVELVAMPAYGAPPPALLARDHAAGTTAVLLETRAYRDIQPDGAPPEWNPEWSRRADMQPLRDLERTEAELRERFAAEGLPEYEASMRVIDEMRRLGFYPMPDTITARAVSGTPPADLPLFDIADGEMASGVFPDIADAILRPGEAVEKSNTTYLIHRDYANSARLNDFLDTGATRFLVRYQGRLWELTIDRQDRGG